VGAGEGRESRTLIYETLGMCNVIRAEPTRGAGAVGAGEGGGQNRWCGFSLHLLLVVLCSAAETALQGVLWEGFNSVCCH
jgi:hypothetical protein